MSVKTSGNISNKTKTIDDFINNGGKLEDYIEIKDQSLQQLSLDELYLEEPSPTSLLNGFVFYQGHRIDSNLIDE